MIINSSSYAAVSQAQPPAMSEAREDVTGLINNKKATIRAYLLAEYNLESDNLAQRKEDLISFLKDIDNTVSNQGEPNGLSRVFRGYAGHFASSVSEDVLNTPEQITGYVLEYMPDIIHKSIHGAYPEGRGKTIHGQNNDTPVTPMPAEMVREVYEALGKKTSEPLLEEAKLQQLQAIPQALPQAVPRALRTHRPERNRAANQTLSSTVYLSGGCCIGSLAPLLIASFIPSSTAAQVLYATGSAMVGLSANIFASGMAVRLGADYASTGRPNLPQSLGTAAAVAHSTGFGYFSGAMVAHATMANTYGLYAGVAGLTAGYLGPVIAGAGAYALNRMQDTRTPGTHIVNGGVEIQRLNNASRTTERS